ncbi:MAG: hypothetical protein AAB691_03465 [Patescibacteria group bacterium]
MARERKHLIEDVFLIALSIGLAFFMEWSGFTIKLTGQINEWRYFGDFFAGMLFTSVFTTAPAIALLGELARQQSPLAVSLIGGLGAMIGDAILFGFIRDRVTDDIAYLRSHAPRVRLPALFRTRLFHRFVPFLGALIIASPLPDELGITLLGLSAVNYAIFLPTSLVFNTLGILVISLIAQGSA